MLDYAVCPIEIWADFLEEKGENITSLRLFIAVACYAHSEVYDIESPSWSFRGAGDTVTLDIHEIFYGGPRDSFWFYEYGDGTFDGYCPYQLGEDWW